MKTEELTTIEHLSNFLEGTQAVAFTISSDNEAADQMKKARQKLFNNIHEQTLKTGH